MCRNVTSIQMTQLKNDCVFTLNIKTCHLTEGTSDNEIQCFRSEPSGESKRLEPHRHRTREWRLGDRLSGRACHNIIGCRAASGAVLCTRGPASLGNGGREPSPRNLIQRSMQRRSVNLNNSKNTSAEAE